MSRLYNTFKNLILKGGTQKTTGEVKKDFVDIAKNLKKKRDAQDNIIKTRDEILRDYKITDQKQKVKTFTAPENFNKGGRVGYKKGTPNPFARKSNRKKIEEAFKVTTPFMVKKKEDKKRMSAKKGSPDPKKKKKFPDLTGDGKVTFADILKGRGVINGKKKPKKKII